MVMPAQRTSEAPSAPLSLPAGARWYIVRTIRHREYEAKFAIDALCIGIQTYLPCECHFAKHGRKLRRVVAPLFRQYLFTRFDLDQHDWWKIRSTRFVDDIICANEIPLRVPDRQLAIIQTAELAGDYDQTKPQPRRQYDPLQPGTKVKITAGPFVGLLAEIRHATARRRVEILFQILGRETRIRIDRLNLQRV